MQIVIGHGLNNCIVRLIIDLNLRMESAITTYLVKPKIKENKSSNEKSFHCDPNI